MRLHIAVGYGKKNLRVPFNIVFEAFGTGSGPESGLVQQT